MGVSLLYHKQMKQKILNCGCHKVKEDGSCWTRNIQISKKGVAGFITKKSNKWEKMKLTRTKKGYMQVGLHKKSYRVNRLIADAFIPNKNNFPDVLHKDDCKANNNVNNLYWGNAKLNAQDRENNGNTAKGERNGMSKLTDEKVLKIKNLLETGNSLLNTAKEFGVSKKIVLLIKQEKIWKHIK